MNMSEEDKQKLQKYEKMYCKRKKWCFEKFLFVVYQCFFW